MNGGSGNEDGAASADLVVNASDGDDTLAFEPSEKTRATTMAGSSNDAPAGAAESWKASARSSAARPATRLGVDPGMA